MSRRIRSANANVYLPLLETSEIGTAVASRNVVSFSLFIRACFYFLPFLTHQLAPRCVINSKR